MRKTIQLQAKQKKVKSNSRRKKIYDKAGDIFEVEYNGEVRRVRVLGFKHDDLVDQTVYGGTHEKQVFLFEFLDFYDR